MSTLKQEYILKLQILIDEIRHECMERFEKNDMESNNSYIDHEIEFIDRQLNRGKLMGTKEHGVKVCAMIVNKIINKC